MGFGALIIGDEIISGKREDKHFAKVVATLKARGLELAWAHYLGDDRARLIDTLRRSFAGDDIVFSFGGIGATPDDHTRQAVAAALGVDLILHPQAGIEIRARFAQLQAATPQFAAQSPQEAEALMRRRLQMGEFPHGADVIPNPYNRICGFSIQRHYFFPGFPVMAWPMLEWVLDTHYRHLFRERLPGEAALIVWEAPESSLADLMEQVVAQFPTLKLFSLPSIGEEGERRHIELGVRGDPAALPAAMEVLRAGVAARGYAFEDKT